METKHNTIHQPHTAYEGEKKQKLGSKLTFFSDLPWKRTWNQDWLNLHHYYFEMNKINVRDTSHS